MTDIKFKHISAGHDGTIWAIGKSDDRIYRLYGNSGTLSWLPDMDSTAEVIAAVDWSSAWCVNKSNEIWHLTGAEGLDVGGTWKLVPTESGKKDAGTISAGGDGSVWYSHKNGTLYHQPQTGEGSSLDSNWVNDKRNSKIKMKILAVLSQDDVWGIDNKGKIWRFDGGSWNQVLTYNGRTGALSIAVAQDLSVWYVGKDRSLYFYLPFANSWRKDNTWKQEEMGSPEVVTIRNQKDIWVLNKDGQVWRALDRQWQQVVGAVLTVENSAA